MQMVLLSSSKAFSGLQERDLPLDAVIWYLPALIAKLIVSLFKNKQIVKVSSMLHYRYSEKRK